MGNNGTSWQTFNMAENDSSSLNNLTAAMNMVYVFTPVGVVSKRALLFFVSAIGIVSFLGNCLLFYFLWKQTPKRAIQSNRFMRNLCMYGKSLSISDILACAVSLPLFCIQISLDVFQSGWACKIVRYSHILFPTVSFNHVTVISLEKYLSVRTVPRTFRVSTVRRVIICAWILSFVVVLLPAATFDGLRMDLNDTHYTIVCRYHPDYYPFNITVIVIFPLLYIFPTMFVTYINICLLKTVWARKERRFANGVTNAYKAKLRAKSIKGITLLVALTSAFIIPYLFYLGNTAYTQLARPQREFTAEYLIRYASGGVAAYISVLINFMMFFAQLKSFRVFLRKLFCQSYNGLMHPDIATTNNVGMGE